MYGQIQEYVPTVGEYGMMRIQHVANATKVIIRYHGLMYIVENKINEHEISYRHTKF